MKEIPKIKLAYNTCLLALMRMMAMKNARPYKNQVMLNENPALMIQAVSVVPILPLITGNGRGKVGRPAFE